MRPKSGLILSITFLTVVFGQDVPTATNVATNVAQPPQSIPVDFKYVNCSERIADDTFNGFDEELEKAENDDRWLLPASAGDDELIMTQILFRHGERTPRMPYPRDPHASPSCWPEGRAQLTLRGRRQARALGASLRRRYGPLLAEDNPSSWRHVRAISSSATRAEQSAAALLAGILPPVGPNVWSELPWQPVPIITVDRNEDNYLQLKTKCPALQNDIATDKYNASNEKLYALLTYYTGKLITSDTVAENVYTCLEIERQMGLKLPSWAYEHYQQLREAAGRSLGASTKTPFRAKLRAGPLIGRLLEGFISSVRTTEKEKPKVLEDDDTELYAPQVLLYSGHDTTIVALLGALGVFDGVPPDFSSAVLWELYRTGNHSFTPGVIYTQLWYSPGHGTPPTILTIPGCGQKCPIIQLQTILSGFITKKWSKDCKVLKPPEPEELEVDRILTSEATKQQSNLSTAAAALTGTIGGLAIVAGLILLVRWRKYLRFHNHREYEPIIRRDQLLRQFESTQAI